LTALASVLASTLIIFDRRFASLAGNTSQRSESSAAFDPGPRAHQPRSDSPSDALIFPIIAAPAAPAPTNDLSANVVLS
jgi:hypothetical protein